MKKIIFFLFIFITFSFSQSGGISGIAPTYIQSGSNYYKKGSLTYTGDEYVYGEIMGYSPPSPPYWIVEGSDGYGFYIKFVSNEPASNGDWTYRKAYKYFYPILNVLDCVAPSTIINGECVAPSIPTCNFGYHNDTTPQKTCVPDVQCPSTMTYYTQQTGTFSFDIKICLPNRELSKEDCQAKGGHYADPSNLTERINAVSSNMDLITAYGKGCYDRAYITSASLDRTIAFALSFDNKIPEGFWKNLANSTMSGGKKIIDYIKGVFSESPTYNQQGLLTHQPEIIDLHIQPDGTYATMDYKLRTQIFEELNGGVEPKPYSPTVKPDLPTPPNVYKGGDITEFQNNIIGTNSYSSAPEIVVVPETSPLNSVVTSDINLKNSFFGSETSPFPVTSTLLEKASLPSGEVRTVTQSRINYPDSSYTDLKTILTRSVDGTKTYEIVATTPIKTSSGTVNYNQTTYLTQNSTGATTNVITNPATINVVAPSGAVVTKPNTTSPSTAPTTDTGTISLANIQAQLEKLNKTSEETKAIVKDLADFTPENKVAFDTALNQYNLKFDNWSLSIDNGINFVNGLVDQMNTLKNNFDNSLAMFDNKPTISIPNGSCTLSVNMYGRTFTADPCMFISPYRPVLSVLFTFFMSFSVFMFALRYMFNFSMKA